MSLDLEWLAVHSRHVEIKPFADDQFRKMALLLLDTRELFYLVQPGEALVDGVLTEEAAKFAAMAPELYAGLEACARLLEEAAMALRSRPTTARRLTMGAERAREVLDKARGAYSMQAAKSEAVAR